MLKEKLKSAIVATGSRSYWNEDLIDDFCEKYKYYDVNKIVEILEDKIIIGIEFRYSDLLKDIRDIQKEQNEQKYITCNYASMNKDHFEILNYVFNNAKNIDEMFTMLEPLRLWLKENHYWREGGRWYEWAKDKE